MLSIRPKVHVQPTLQTWEGMDLVPLIQHSFKDHRLYVRFGFRLSEITYKVPGSLELSFWGRQGQAIYTNKDLIWNGR